VPAKAAVEESRDVVPACSPSVERAALAFSAIPTRAALDISSRLTLLERSQLREGLTQVRNADEAARREAVHELVRAVQAGVGFPAPAPHDEANCPFRRIEQTPADDLAAVLAACARTQPALVAITLCHISAQHRAEVWSRFDQDERAAVRLTLSQVPGMSAARTAMYALDLRDRIAHRR
jgi:hypothetical protein